VCVFAGGHFRSLLFRFSLRVTLLCFSPFIQAGCALAVGPYSLFTLRFVAGLCMGGADLVGLVSFVPFIVLITVRDWVL